MTCDCGNTLNLLHITTCLQQKHALEAMDIDIKHPQWWSKTLGMITKRYTAAKDMLLDSTLLRTVIDSYLL